MTLWKYLNWIIHKLYTLGRMLAKYNDYVKTFLIIAKSVHVKNTNNLFNCNCKSQYQWFYNKVEKHYRTYSLYTDMACFLTPTTFH